MRILFYNNEYYNFVFIDMAPGIRNICTKLCIRYISSLILIVKQRQPIIYEPNNLWVTCTNDEHRQKTITNMQMINHKCTCKSVVPNHDVISILIRNLWRFSIVEFNLKIIFYLKNICIYTQTRIYAANQRIDVALLIVNNVNWYR